MNHFTVPLMTREAYALATGLPLGVVEGHIQRGLVPLVKVGKRSLINVEALRVKAAVLGETFVLGKR